MEPFALVERLAADSDAPRAARAAAAQMLGRLDGHATQRADDLTLAVSELVTNAVLHGCPPGTPLELRLTGSESMIRVEVCDDGTARFDWPASSGNGHWGLALVRRFSDRAGITRQPTTVWCEFDLANGT